MRQLRVTLLTGMCEIPSNVILAKEFLEIFDGYSIGSNDLTQLCLGVDRDSAIVSKFVRSSHSLCRVVHA
jgi:phosphoenolpyruvate synthase/pyruvate phosphate dikinase